MQAATYHKTGIDAMLHPRQAGATPYRIILGDVRQKLVNTRRQAGAAKFTSQCLRDGSNGPYAQWHPSSMCLWTPCMRGRTGDSRRVRCRRMEDILTGHTPDEELEWYETKEELAGPLLAIFWSLWECGAGIVADGRLLDLIRRLFAFGVVLLRMDLRQEASRHTEALDAVTRCALPLTTLHKEQAVYAYYTACGRHLHLDACCQQGTCSQFPGSRRAAIPGVGGVKEADVPVQGAAGEAAAGPTNGK